ncbi:MAG: YggS family pyridoxal phosphate-dependent enzyme [Bacteroidetes bacterium CG12_big_fil_rev_8_21_14_0_65_60_17]|nr:MAG: YggS family pyridoxal phosphate-dependent enzyme [Bacteroidetes bacterium CG12_big_fil_rev_8_21_14_0_65_60_17]
MTSNLTIQERYQHIHDRVARAAGKAGRSASDVTLVAVSKTFPASDIARHHGFGQMDFGENKIQELTLKQESLSNSHIRWHYIGHLQRNKAKFLTSRVHLFHALDSVRLARELNKRLAMDDQTLDCLLQVNVSGEDSKFGVDPEHVDRVLTGIAGFDRLRVQGLMTLAAPAADPELVRGQFALLREVAARHDDHMQPPHNGGPLLSMGMSSDFEVAIEEGATHIRIGSLLFGERT